MWIQTVGCLLIICSLVGSDTTPTLTKLSQPYQFGYSVSDKSTGDIKSHQEVNDGKEVRGRYSLVEPNGDLRVVTYTADSANGFRANVNVEPRSQPTPTYHLVKLRPPQKLRRQHDEPTSTTAASVKDDGTPQENQIDPLTSTIREGQKNKTNNEEIMTVIKDFHPLGVLVSPTEYTIGNGGERINDNPFGFQTPKGEGPQIIPVKIEEDSSLSGSGTFSEIKEPVLKIEVTTLNPINNTKKETTSQDKATQLSQNLNLKVEMTSNSSKTNLSNINGEHISLPKSQTTNNTDQKSVVKSMLELNIDTDKISTIQPTIGDLFTTMGYFTTSQLKPLQTENTEDVKAKPSEIKGEKEIQERTKINTNKTIAADNNGNKKMAETRPNNMMLAALLVPTAPILKFTCVPDQAEKNNFKMTQNMPSNAPVAMGQRIPQPISLGPGGSVFTPNIPLYPFQMVNFTPIKNIFTPLLNNKLTSQNPLSFFSTKPPMTTVPPNTVFRNTGTTVPQQTMKSDHKEEDALVKPKPPNAYTNLRSEGSPGHAHKVQSSHYPHHLLPPPWAPHPLRPSHNSHYRHMPIFVLPMSHNFNFAPTFDPALIEQHNH